MLQVSPRPAPRDCDHQPTVVTTGSTAVLFFVKQEMT
jgi:hypothetical protein